MPPCINGRYHALTAEFISRLSYKLRISYRRRIDRNLIGACAQKTFEVIDCTDAAAYCQRHKDLLRGFAHNILHCAARLMGCSNIEKDDLICALLIIQFCAFNRIAHIAQAYKVDSLYHTPVLYVKARNYSFGEHGRFPPWRGAGALAAFIASFRSSVPL